MIYEYECDDCEHNMIVEQSIKDDALEVCPMCESEKFERIISNTHVVFNGTGWANDGYSKKHTTTY